MGYTPPDPGTVDRVASLLDSILAAAQQRLATTPTDALALEAADDARKALEVLAPYRTPPEQR